MPFMGRDWRSPGEAWVKTDGLGWQRMKIIESKLYPPSTACYQSQACSWPPKSDYGEYMAENGKQIIERDLQNESNISSRHNASGNRPFNLRSNSVNSSDDSGESSNDSSPNNSRDNSSSPSPFSSPGKSAPYQAIKHDTHHVHPITISSPYGTYSCCAHHSDFNKPATVNHTHDFRSAVAHDNVYRANSMNDKSNPHAHNYMTRSLSRESMRQTLDTQHSAESGASMRQNRSISDFRVDNCLQQSSPESDRDNAVADSRRTQAERPLNSSAHDPKGASQLVQPTLLKNGQPLEYDNCKPDEFEDVGSRDVCCCCMCRTNEAGEHKIVEDAKSHAKSVPYCRISVRTKEVAMYNTIGEAFYRLDFCNAIHDIRRFNYICKLLHLLITQNLTSLSGCATKILFTMLEQIAIEGKLDHQRNQFATTNVLTL